MRRTQWILFALLPAFVLAGCGGDDDDNGGGGETAIVTISGTAGVEAGQTLQLSASTANGTDGSYTWNSSDPNVATVDADGLVTGVAAGDAVITATGADTGASDTHAIVVFEVGPDVGPLADIVTAWEGSGHADSEAEAFRHWDEDGEISTSCARCHSTQGFIDYAEDKVVDNAVPASENDGITCAACHANAPSGIGTVEFPSGVILTDLSGSSRCQTCHQGREATDSLDARLIDETTGEPIADDALVPGGRFVNVHYFAAGATLNGTLVRGGYQYADMAYDARFQHAEGLNQCASCHNPHTLEIKLDACGGCHTGVSEEAGIESVYDIRMAASGSFDYDGDGNTTEGIYYEVEGLRELLLPAIQDYASATEGVGAICYNESAYPYWFGPGTDATCLTEDDESFGNWTPRLLKATYNYQYSGKDPGGFAHNGKYVIELIYDSLADMGVDVTGLQRGDFGHFDGSAEPFRHWDEYAEDGTFIGEVEGGCSKCHGGVEGFTNYLAAFEADPETPVDEEALPAIPATHVNGLDCTVCHSSASTFELRNVASFRFPSGVVISDYDVGGDQMGANICATCHSGREAQATIDAYLAELAEGTAPRFRNVHYKPAAGSLFGAEANVGYQYEGKTYAGRFTHTGGESNECTFCHRPEATDHTFMVNLDNCTQCHGTAVEVTDIRMGAPDVDGDGDTSETMADELAALREALLAQISLVSTSPVCYGEASYPYWFNDTNGNGTCDPEELDRTNGFSAFTADTVAAAHNYQFATKDPGSWAHGYDYHAQLLIDSIEALGGDISGFNRP